VAVIQRSGYNAPKLGEHLPPSARPVLRELGVVEPSYGHSGGVTILWGGAIQHNDYLFNPNSYGFNLDRWRFDGDLAAVVALRGGVVLRRTLANPIFNEGEGAWTITATSAGRRPTQLSARFVVDATGRASAVGRMFGSHRRRLDRLVGVVAQGALAPGDAGLGGRLVVESAGMGWWYALKLPTGQGTIVLMTDADAVRQRSSSIVSLWQREFAQTRLIGAVLPELRDPPRVAVRLADTSILEPMHGSGWLAVGEAGVAYDPLSGRGVLDALESGLLAGTAIDGALDGATGALDKFARERRGRFHHYLDERRAVYQQEQRWPTSQFWLRRRPGAASSLASMVQPEAFAALRRSSRT
jgi:flavin-dependent dehydrogenase